MTRRGYTLVELLVAIGILAVLVGLTLLAIQKARLAARVAENKNQVRQLMLATHVFADARDGRLPGAPHNPSCFDMLVGGDPTADQRPLQPSFDIQIGRLNYANDPPLPPGESHVTVITLFVNPTDPSWTHYQTGQRPTPGNCGYGANALAFAGNTRLQASFADGTSNTLAVAERYSRCRDDRHPFTTDIIWCQSHSTLGPGRPSLRPRAPTFADAFYDDTRPAVKDGRTVANRPSRPFQLAPHPSDCDPFVPQATTPGGLVVGLVDGSVRVVGGGVNTDLFWAAVTPAAGDVGSLDD